MGEYADPECGNTNNQSQGQANLSTITSGDTPISDFIIEKIPFSSQDWVIAATTFDVLAEIADIYAVYIVIYGAKFGAGIALPFVAAGAPEVPVATGLAGAMIAELYAQPAIKVGNAFATLSTASTFVSETKTERTIIEQGKMSPATLNSVSLTTLGWIAPSEAFLSLTIQSFALANDFGFTSLPFPSR